MRAAIGRDHIADRQDRLRARMIGGRGGFPIDDNRGEIDWLDQVMAKPGGAGLLAIGLLTVIR